MFIDGFGISGYRSFGSEHQFIGHCEKINLLIGQNNSGKSNILTFLKNHYNAVIGSINDGSQLNFTNLDRHIGSGSGSMKVSFGQTILKNLSLSLLTIETDLKQKRATARVAPSKTYAQIQP